MRITLHQTASGADIGEQGCCICGQKFHLGPATCWAIGKSNILWGEVCPACIQGGSEHIQQRLELRARWSKLTALQDTEAAEEGISECPSLEDFLVAERFYEKPMFKTGEEYREALERGEVPDL